jgi:polyisoprenyl-phosphate glycosyltransferase
MSGTAPEFPHLPSFPLVSILIPLFNEEEAVPHLLEALEALLGQLPQNLPHEIVLVDDGSTDATLSLLRTAARGSPAIRVVSLSRNFGHQAALSAGLEHARGDVVFVIDGDLQDDPALLFDFVDEYRRGADVVYAKRMTRPESLWLRWAYRLHYRLLRLISSPPLPLDAGDCALLSRRVVDAMVSMPERQRYLRGMRAWVGFTQVGIPVERRERAAGSSKYGMGRLIALSLDGLLAFSVVPLRIATGLGLASLVAGAGYGLFALAYRVFVGAAPQGFTTLVLLQVLLGGAILSVLGVIGEYVGRIYEEVKQRPIYLIREVIEGSERHDG